MQGIFESLADLTWREGSKQGLFWELLYIIPVLFFNYTETYFWHYMKRYSKGESKWIQDFLDW